MGDATPVLRRAELEAYRWCLGCRLQHPESSFVGQGGRTTTRCAVCRAKRNAKPRTQIRTPDVVRAQNLRQKYGITVEDYDALRAAQDYRCAICGTHEDEIRVVFTGRPRKDGKPAATAARLVVDHCHDSGRVRGLLCSGCNSAIGHFGESPTAMMAAIRYLRLDASRPVRTDMPIAVDTP